MAVIKTYNEIRIGDKIQCETDRDELFVGYVTRIIDAYTLIFEDEDNHLPHTALAAWCEVVYDCEDCQDTGEIVYDELDPDSKQYMHGTGTKPCHCKQPSLFDENE